MKALLVLALALASQVGYASELDNEQQVTNVAARAKDLPQTVVIRVNNQTGEKQIVEMANELQESQLSSAELEKLAFKSFEVDAKYAANSLNEIDRDAARESWYYYVGYYPYGYGYGYGYGSYYYPTYYYGGYYYPYSAYYGYAAYGWNYYYYRPYAWWW